MDRTPSTAVAERTAVIPTQPTREHRRPKPTQTSLSSLLNPRYRRLMGDAPKTWADYITWAKNRIGHGGIAELARRTGLHRSTLFEWKNGQGSNPTVDSIRLVADAVGDDLRNALRAAGQLPPDEPAPTPTATGAGIQPLAQEIARLRDEGERLGSPPEDIADKVAQVIDVYERLAEQVARIRALGERLGTPPDEIDAQIAQVVEVYHRLVVNVRPAPSTRGRRTA